MFDQKQFLADLDTFLRFKTCVGENEQAFVAARAWIRAFFDPERTEILEQRFNGFTNLIIKPLASERPKLIGDGHIEVVPGGQELFALRQEGDRLYGRGVADMKTQCLMMMTVLRELIEQGKHHDFWLLLSEDEEIGSHYGVRRMVEYLHQRHWLPDVVFVPDGGPHFAYVEKEKGIVRFTVTMPGLAAHGSRPFLGENAIERMWEFYERLRAHFPNPRQEAEWIPSLAMTRIEAGKALNKLPDSCWAGFDLRFTENETAGEIATVIEELAALFGAEVEFREKGVATYYPRERPVARRYIEILRRVSGREPPIVHTNGASNARYYVARKPEIQILMSNPAVVGLHADDECVLASSLPAYFELVQETARLL